MRTKLARGLLLAAALLFAVDGASAGAIPKFGHYKGTIRVAKTWSGLATTRSATPIMAVYSDPGVPPITSVTVQYRPTPFLDHFWSETVSDVIWLNNIGADGKGWAQFRDDALNWISGTVVGQQKSMIIKLERDGDGGHPAVQIVINLTWVRPP